MSSLALAACGVAAPAAAAAPPSFASPPSAAGSRKLALEPATRLGEMPRCDLDSTACKGGQEGKLCNWLHDKVGPMAAQAGQTSGHSNGTNG